MGSEDEFMRETSSKNRFLLPTLFGIVNGMGYAAACLKGRGSIVATIMTNRTRRFEWSLALRACAVVLLALLSRLVAGCIVIPLPAAEVKVAQSGDVQAPSSGIALSVLFSHDFSPETSSSLGEEIVECVTHGLAKEAPEVRLVSEEEFHRAIFGLKPGEVFLQADTIATLLARPDIGQRAREVGVTHFFWWGVQRKPIPSGQVNQCEARDSPPLSSNWRAAESERCWRALKAAKATLLVVVDPVVLSLSFGFALPNHHPARRWGQRLHERSAGGPAMKANELKQRPHATWLAPGSLRLFQPRKVRSVLVLLAAAISAGCVYSVPEPVLIREPRPDPIPLRIGVYYPPEFQSYTYRHHFSDTAWILGEPSVKLIREALALLFIEVVDVPRPSSGTGLRGDPAGVIEPRIASAEAVYWSEEHIKAGVAVQPVHVNYGFTLYSPRGESVASWDVTGRGEEPNSNPLAAVSTLERNFERAMQKAAWKFTSGFRDIPEVRRWLTGRENGSWNRSLSQFDKTARPDHSRLGPCSGDRVNLH